MKIDTVEVYPVSMYVKHHFADSKAGFLRERKAVVVIIHSDEGIYGIGEAFSYPPIDGEIQQSMLGIINDYMIPVLIGEDPFNLEAIIDKMGRVIPGNLKAKAAVDIALYDLMGKKLGVPTYKLLGGCYRERVPLMSGMGLTTDPEKSANMALEQVNQGFKLIKIKVGADPKMDIEGVRAVREAVSDKAEISVDANGAWNVSEAIKIIRKLERYDLHSVEQPVPGWDFDGLAEVTKAVDTPVMADESLTSPESALKLVKMGAADIFTLKPPKHGGLYNTKKIAMIAEAASIPCLLASTQGNVGTAAQAHFAMANKVVTIPCAFAGELAGFEVFEKDYVREPIPWYMKPFPHIRLRGLPGLGLDVDYEKLKKLLTPYKRSSSSTL